MLQRAYDLGFTSYCLSEHVPRSRESQLYPEEVKAGLTPVHLEERFEAYLKEARRCSQLYSSSSSSSSSSRSTVEGESREEMQVLVGAELENIDQDCLEYLERILNDTNKNGEGSGSVGHENASLGCAAAGSIGKGKVDFLVGSLHHVNSVPIDFDQQTFELALANFSDSEEDDRGEGSDMAVKRRRQHLRLISAYLDQQKRLIDHFQPEVIGHFDLCRLYEPLTPMTVAGLEEGEEEKDDECTNLLKQVEEKVRRNISLVVEYGGLFEINSSSIRKGWPTAYPGEDILDMILSLNGRICLSDDAHSHEQVGLNYDRARDFLTRKGVKSIWMLQRKKSASTDGVPFPRGTYAAEVEEWASHPFWSTQRPRPL